MEMAFWGAMILTFLVGAGASFVSQYATAGKGVEAAAKGRALRQSLEHLRERNARRRDRRDARQSILDSYRERKIEGKNVADQDALDEAIEQVAQETEALRESILDSERIITEYDNTLTELAVQRATSTGVLLVASTLIGGFTAALFGFINYLASESGVASVTGSVTVTSSVIVQSLALGAGWPLVWEKFLASDKLEAATTAAVARFENRVKEAEREQV